MDRKLMSGRVRRLVGSVAISSAAALAACLGEDIAPVTQEPIPGVDASTPSSSADGGGTPPSDAGTPPVVTSDASDASNRFCATQAPPMGTADFFCADFDGPDVFEGFVPNVPDAGTLTKITDIFFSPPAALTVRGNARVRWEKAGPTAFDSIDARVRVNVTGIGGAVPPSAGSVTVLGLYTPDTQLEIRYVRGANVDGASYIGYLLGWSHCSAGCLAGQAKLATMNLPLNLWEEVQMVWASDGNAKVTVGATEVFKGMTYGPTSTVVGVQLGLEENASSPPVGRHAYDNLVVAVRRK